MKSYVMLSLSVILTITGVLRAHDEVEWAKSTAQSARRQYQPHIAIDGKFDRSFSAWISESYGGGTKADPKDVWWMLEMPHKIRVQGVKIIGDDRGGIPLLKNFRVEYRENDSWKTAAEVRDATTKTVTITWPEPLETTTFRVYVAGRDVPDVVRIVEVLLILPGGEEKTVPEILGLSEIQAAIPCPGPEFPSAVAAGLPKFQYKGVVLDYKDLKYNPCDDAIVPSVIRTDKLPNPLGRFYMYYAPHNVPGGICLAYADSLEGPWKEYSENPIISRDWQPHYKVSHVSSPNAIWMEDEGKLFVYYHGENHTTRFASSTDGIHFQYEDVAITTKMYQDINEASYATVFRYTIPGKDNRYIMLFMGNNKGTRRIYMATSKDGRTWEPRLTPLIDPPAGTSQVAQPWYFPWKGKHYVIYHGHWTVQIMVADLHASEVDPSFEQSKHVGLLYDHATAGPENVAQMSPCIIEDQGKLYLFTNIGPRLHQKVALGIAETNALPPQK